MKLDGDTLSTVPDDPPAAGPDRALDAPPPDPVPPATPLAVVGTAGAAVVEWDAARPTESPSTAHISAAATAIHRRLLLASNRRILGLRACSAVGEEADQSGEEAGGGGGVVPVPPELPAADGSEVVFDAGRPERVS